MSSKEETRFKRKVVEDLESIGCYVEKIQQVAKRGTSDLFVCAGGFMVVIELKRSQAEKASPLQRRKMDRVELAGGFATVACPENWPKRFEIVKEIKRRGDAFQKQTKPNKEGK